MGQHERHGMRLCPTPVEGSLEASYVALISSSLALNAAAGNGLLHR